MSGQFGRHPLLGRGFGYFQLIVGSFIAIRFGSWMIASIRSDSTLAMICFNGFFTFLGLIWGLSSIFVSNYNRKAYLEVTETRVTARYGWNQTLDLALCDVWDVDARHTFLTLYTKDGEYHISTLMNAVEIGYFILDRIEKHVWEKDVDASKKKAKRAKTGFIVFAVLIALCVIAVILSFFVLVRATHGNFLDVLNGEEDRTFVVFFAVLVLLFALMCVFAVLLAEMSVRKERYGSVERACAAYANRRAELDGFPGIIGVLYYNCSICRVVAYRDGSFRYMPQHFELGSGWVDFFKEPREFDTLAQLEDDIREEFANVILESE